MSAHNPSTDSPLPGDTLDTVFAAVLRTARRVAGASKLPAHVRNALKGWTRGRLADGVDPDVVPDLVAGTASIEVRTGEPAAERAEVPVLLEQPAASLGRAVRAGAFDDRLGDLAAHAVEPPVTDALADRQLELARASMLSGNLSEVAQSLESGRWDDDLDGLWKHERAHKDRKGAFALLDTRRSFVEDRTTDSPKETS